MSSRYFKKRDVGKLMIRIDDDFFERCRKENLENRKNFFLIKEWALGAFKHTNERDYSIKLTFHIIGPGREQLNLNKHRQGSERPDPGVEIPPDRAQEIAGWLLKQLGSEAYQKGQCKKEWTEEKYGYKFEIIRKFAIDNFTDINLKLMYNENETKYFINKQKGFSSDSNRKGVEIPKQMLEQIAQYLVIASEKIQ